MRKLAVLAALCLMPATAMADKVLVVVPPATAADDANYATDKASTDRFYTICKEIFSRFIGAEVKYTDPRTIVTEDIRTGTVVWGRGTAGARAESFDAVVYLSPYLGNENYGSRTDSVLCVARGGPQVPILYLFSDRKGFTGLPWPAVATTACCTSGVADIANPQMGQGYISQRDRTRRWVVDGNYTMGVSASATPPASGLRKLVTMGHMGLTFRSEAQGFNCGWCDSLIHPTTSDTMAVWEIPFSNIAGARPLVMAWADGVGGFGDSLNNAVGPLVAMPAEISPSIILVALARLDSLMGGTLLRKRSVAFAIDGGWTRGNRHDNFYESDSATLKRAIDSLATLNIPLTLGVNTDSLTYYTRDKAWWATLGALRYSPQPSTSTGAGASSFQFPHDIWGKNRSRTVYGGGTFAGADTSIDCLLAGALWKCDSTFGREKVERFGLVIGDDWTPANFTTGMKDSLGWVLGRRGFKGIRVNTQDGALTAEGNLGTLATKNSLFNRQFMWKEPIGGRELLIAGNNGQPITGGSYQWSTFRDSVGPSYDSSAFFPIHNELTRGWYGFTVGHDGWGNIDAWAWGNAYDSRGGVTNATPFMDVVWPKSDLFYRVKAGYIKTLHVRDFSGSPTNTYWGTAPLNGWWIVKSMVMAAREINATAGRTIVDFTYPSNVTVP